MFGLSSDGGCRGERRKGVAMKLLEWLLRTTPRLDVRPEPFGAFHMIFVAVILLLGMAMILLRRYLPKGEGNLKKMLILFGVGLLLLETGKQIVYSYTAEGGWLYNWDRFPFQFCSTPMYAGLLAALVRNKKIHNALCAYLATFALFAGLCVMLYPADVFISTIGINIQTMICHGTMLTVGIYLLATGYVKSEHRTVLRAIPVFAACIILAMIMNEAAHLSGLLERETFNMFFISPHCEGTLPVYSIVQKYVPFPFCTIIYISVFSLAAYVILLISMATKKLASKNIKNNKRSLAGEGLCCEDFI